MRSSLEGVKASNGRQGMGLDTLGSVNRMLLLRNLLTQEEASRCKGGIVHT